MKMINHHDYNYYQLSLKGWYDYGIFDTKEEAIKLFKRLLPKELQRYDLKKYVSRFWMRDRSSWK